MTTERVGISSLLTTRAARGSCVINHSRPVPQRPTSLFKLVKELLLTYSVKCFDEVNEDETMASCQINTPCMTKFGDV